VEGNRHISGDATATLPANSSPFQTMFGKRAAACEKQQLLDREILGQEEEKMTYNDFKKTYAFCSQNFTTGSRELTIIFEVRAHSHAFRRN